MVYVNKIVIGKVEKNAAPVTAKAETKKTPKKGRK